MTFYKKPFLKVLLAVLALPICGLADSPSIAKSLSPDGKINLTAEGKPDNDGGDVFIIKISEVKTSATLGSFEWDGAHSPLDQSAPPTVLWRPDGKYFALSYEVAPGLGSCAVYGLSGGKWARVDLPDFASQITKENAGAQPALTGKGHETATSWLPGHRLEIHAAYGGISDPAYPGTDREFRVVLQFSEKGSSATLVSVAAMGE